MDWICLVTNFWSSKDGFQQQPSASRKVALITLSLVLMSIFPPPTGCQLLSSVMVAGDHGRQWIRPSLWRSAHSSSAVADLSSIFEPRNGGQSVQRAAALRPKSTRVTIKRPKQSRILSQASGSQIAPSAAMVKSRQLQTSPIIMSPALSNNSRQQKPTSIVRPFTPTISRRRQILNANSPQNIISKNQNSSIGLLPMLPSGDTSQVRLNLPSTTIFQPEPIRQQQQRKIASSVLQRPQVSRPIASSSTFPQFVSRVRSFWPSFSNSGTGEEEPKSLSPFPPSPPPVPQTVQEVPEPPSPPATQSNSNGPQIVPTPPELVSSAVDCMPTLSGASMRQIGVSANCIGFNDYGCEIILDRCLTFIGSKTRGRGLSPTVSTEDRPDQNLSIPTKVAPTPSIVRPFIPILESAGALNGSKSSFLSSNTNGSVPTVETDDAMDNNQKPDDTPVVENEDSPLTTTNKPVITTNKPAIITAALPPVLENTAGSPAAPQTSDPRVSMPPRIEWTRLPISTNTTSTTLLISSFTTTTPFPPAISGVATSTLSTATTSTTPTTTITTADGIHDQHELCCFWAKMDECMTNPKWMKVNCRKSCGTINCEFEAKSSTGQQPPSPSTTSSKGVRKKRRRKPSSGSGVPKNTNNTTKKPKRFRRRRVRGRGLPWNRKNRKSNKKPSPRENNRKGGKKRTITFAGETKVGPNGGLRRRKYVVMIRKTVNENKSRCCQNAFRGKCYATSKLGDWIRKQCRAHCGTEQCRGSFKRTDCPVKVNLKPCHKTTRTKHFNVPLASESGPYSLDDGDCKNRDKMCNFWAKKRYQCHLNPSFMLSNCRPACDMCLRIRFAGTTN